MLVLTTTLTATLPKGMAQNYTQIGLPESAKARLGKGTISEITYSADGKRLAVASGIGVWIYDAQSGEELALFTGHLGGARSVSFSPDSQTLASGSWDKTVRLWDIHTGVEKRIFTGHTDYVTSISFSPDGKILASGSWDKTVRLWDIHTGVEKHIFTGHSGRVYSVSFSPDGKTLASASGGAIRLWNIDTRTLLQTFTGHKYVVDSVSFSPDGKTLASASGGRYTVMGYRHRHTLANIRCASIWCHQRII